MNRKESLLRKEAMQNKIREDIKQLMNKQLMKREPVYPRTQFTPEYLPESFHVKKEMIENKKVEAKEFTKYEDEKEKAKQIRKKQRKQRKRLLNQFNKNEYVGEEEEEDDKKDESEKSESEDEDLQGGFSLQAFLESSQKRKEPVKGGFLESNSTITDVITQNGLKQTVSITPTSVIQVNGTRDTHIYYNISILNNTTDEETPATVYDSRAQPILLNASDYFVSVVRFSVPATSIPLQYENLDASGNIINWFVTFDNNGSPFAKTPVPYIYYNAFGQSYLYSYQHLADMVNSAFLNAYTASGLSSTLGAPPKMIYNPVTELYSIIVPIAYVTNNVTIYFSNELYKQFSNFPAYFYDIGSPTGLDEQLLFKNYYNNCLDASGNQINFDVPTITPAYYVITQEYTTLYSINQFKSVVFLTSTIPILAESIPASMIAGLNGNIQTNQGALNSTSANSLSILTDFELNASAISTARSEIQYYPQGPYRLTELVGTGPLNTIDIQVYFQDTQNNLYPLYLEPSEYASIKLLFRKKTLGV